MKCQILFSGEKLENLHEMSNPVSREKKGKNNTNLSSAELAKIVVKVKDRDCNIKSVKVVLARYETYPIFSSFPFCRCLTADAVTPA